MAELTNNQLLVSANGTTLDAEKVRLAAPLEGEAAYSSEEELAEYGDEHGVPLVQPGEGVSLSTPELADYLLIDTHTGMSYAVGAGWKVIDYSTYEEFENADSSDPSTMRELAQAGAEPGAPENFSSLKSLPFESVTGAF